MGGALQLVGDWGHIVGAALFAVLAIWISRRLAAQRHGKLLVAALMLTSVWLLSIAFNGVDRMETGIMESLRNCGWLVYLFVLPAQSGQKVARQARGAIPLYGVLALLLVAQSALDILAGMTASTSGTAAAIHDSAIALRMLWAIGALILVQRIYSACPASLRAMIAPVAASMAAMWSYDLVLYGSAFLRDGMVAPLYALRGGLMAALAPAIALVVRTSRKAVVAPSRALALRGIGILAGAVATLMLIGLLLAVGSVSDPVVRSAVAGALFLIVAGGLLMVPATRVHRAANVLIAKHLFRHRYDYRAQWMGFVDTIGRDDRAGEDIHTRLVKAMADITQSSAGVLLMPEEGGRFNWNSPWNWKGGHPEVMAFDPVLVERMRTRSWIVDLAEARASSRSGVPDWLLQRQEAWALIPLVHFGELVGVILLDRPPIMRPLDWEDFDMLRTAGRQVASYIAEARGRVALEDARRFDEFNRRFAFIMHDIKNLVSQIALVARNAERHADNPAFRTDMILTLKDCADRMNRLIVRLSGHNGPPDAKLSRFEVGVAVQSAITARVGAHQLITEGDTTLVIEADRARIEQIIGHLVQNAVEASADSDPIIVRAARAGDEIQISVIDRGRGMTPEFIRDELFRPFMSTKSGGFGIGAYEARELARAIGGRLAVESTPGKGSCFTLHLPLREHMLAPREAHENSERVA